MVSLTKALNPDDIERHVTRALGDGPPVGRVQETWHIIRLIDGNPALILFRHTNVTLEHLYRLCHLMLESGISHGYLAVIAPISAEISYAAGKIGIDVLNRKVIERLLEYVLREDNYDSDDDSPKV